MRDTLSKLKKALAGLAAGAGTRLGNAGRRAVVGVMTAVLALSTLMGALSPVVASAQGAESGPKKVSVTLVDTDHGKLSVQGTEGRTATVKAGDTVTVDVAADEGYFADQVELIPGEGDPVAVPVKDGRATFTVAEDVLVSATFYENGSAGSAALDAVEVEKGAYQSVEEYVKKHADAEYTGKGSEPKRADVLTVTTTVVDGKKLPEGTLDALWRDDDGDDISDHTDALLSQAVSHAVLFELDPDADYYVGWAGADIEGAKLTEFEAAENSADAKLRKGFIMDEQTGLVYVPKKYTEKNDKGEAMVASSRVQLVYSVEDAGAAASFGFKASKTGVDGDVAGKGSASVPVTAAYTRVVLAEDEAAKADITGATVDSVSVNGIEYDADSGMWEYDADEGALVFKMAPAGVHAMKVTMSNNLMKRVASVFSTRAAVNNIGTWEFDDAPWAGQAFTVKAHNKYNARRQSGYTMPAVENPTGGNYENKTVLQAMGWQGVDLSKLQSGFYSVMRYSNIHAQDTGSVKIASAANVGLTCGHIGVTPSFERDDNYNQGENLEDDLGAHVRVMSVSGNTAIVGITVPTCMTQAAAGFFEISWTIAQGSFNLTKKSSNEDITKGNDCYSLEGAQYGIYSDIAATKLVKTITTDADGKVWSGMLDSGTYYVKETQAPSGYALDDTVHSVTVGGSTAAELTVSDKPQNDPAVMVASKVDKETGKADPQGKGTLAGAEFTVKYYAGFYDTVDELPASATRSWVLKTDGDGFVSLQGALLDPEKYFSSGDVLFKDGGGNATLPLGTVTVQETKAPEGYLLSDNSIKLQQVTSEGYLESVQTFVEPTAETAIKEQVVRGGIKVRKYDKDFGAQTSGDSSFEGVKVAIVNAGDHSVKVDGTEYKVGETVKTLTLGADGTAATAADALPYGDYRLQEVDGGGDYTVNSSWRPVVEVRANGHVYEMTDTEKGLTDEASKGGIAVQKRDLENDSTTAQGDATFEGAQVKIVNRSAHAVRVDGAVRQPGETVKTLTLDKKGYAETGERELPFGTYEVTESRAPQGYLLNTTWKKTVQVRQDGKVYKLDDPAGKTAAGTGAESAVPDQVKRGDVAFNKVSSPDMTRMPNVAFLVTSKTTGEAHVVVTDENGMIDTSSAWASHGSGTNANDAALGADGEIADESKLSSENGLWFYGSKDDRGAAPDDSKGSLPYDTYEFRELRGTTNAGKELVSFDVTVTRDGYKLDLGTVTNQTPPQPKLGTALRDAEGSQSPVADGSTALTDTVDVSDMTEGQEYALTMKLWDQTAGAFVKGGDGTDLAVTQKFTAKSTSTTVRQKATIDSTDLAGHVLTAYEYLADGAGNVLVSHEDATDENQTVQFPSVSTAADDGQGRKMIAAVKDAKISDTVSYSGITPDREYTLTATLHLVETAEDGTLADGGEVKGADGEPVSATKTFTADAAEGSTAMELTFDASELGGRDVVVFETMEDRYGTVAEHKDIADADQTMYVPAIGTTAAGEDGTKAVRAAEGATVTDTVKYENLTPGEEYELRGELHELDADGKDLGAAKSADGAAITSNATFTAEQADGTADVTFTFDGSALAGKRLVVFESLLREGAVIAEHKDAADEGQQVKVVKIGTEAEDSEGGKLVLAEKGAKVVDTVSYEGLVPGREYTVSGTLMDKKTGKALKGADGKDVTAQAVFTPDKADGEVNLTFEFDASGLGGRDLVAFEELASGEKVWATHKDIDDGKQTVSVPKVGTTAVTGNGTHEAQADGEFKVTDTVAYENLTAGRKYTVEGVLHLRENGRDDSKAEPEAEVMDVAAVPAAEKADGAKAADVGKAEGAESAGGEEEGAGEEKATYVDGGTVKDKDGKDVSAKAEFTAEKESGEVKLDFTFDASQMAGRTVVAFETVKDEGKTVAEHKDIRDDAQAVTVLGIGTQARDASDGDQVIEDKKDQKVTDTVSLQGLKVGETYELTATAYSPKDGAEEPEQVFPKTGAADEAETKAVEGDAAAQPAEGTEGKGVTADTEAGDETAAGDEGGDAVEVLGNGRVRFTATDTDMEVEVPAAIDATGLNGRKVVFFESLTQAESGTEVAKHADMDDSEQTLEVKTPEGETPTSEMPQTGGIPAPAILAAAGAMIALGAAMAMGPERKRARA